MSTTLCICASRIRDGPYRPLPVRLCSHVCGSCYVLPHCCSCLRGSVSHIEQQRQSEGGLRLSRGRTSPIANLPGDRTGAHRCSYAAACCWNLLCPSHDAVVEPAGDRYDGGRRVSPRSSDFPSPPFIQFSGRRNLIIHSSQKNKRRDLHAVHQFHPHSTVHQLRVTY